MAPEDYTALTRRLALARAQQLRWLADVDPTLTLLAQALERERATASMTLPQLVAYVESLASRYGPAPR
jgi:hypothetical protein